MLKRISVLFLFLSLTATVFAQQEPMYSQYVYNGLLINPAYAGTREVFSATAMMRNQWIGIPGAPRTGVMSVESLMKNYQIGLGLNMVYDEIGITNHSGISGIYSYKVYFPQSSLSFGLQAGIGFYNSTYTQSKYSDNSQTDPAFIQDYHRILPNFSFGMYYHSDRFYLGVAEMNILGRTIQEKIYPNAANDMGIGIASHYFVTSGYLFDITEDWKFQSSFLVKYVGGAPLEADLNALVLLRDLLVFGASYRSYASLDVMTHIRINKNLSVGYSYEYSTNELNNFTTGSHEIMLRYQFAGGDRKFVSPRYF